MTASMLAFLVHLGTQITSSYTLNNSVKHAPASVKCGATIDKDLKINKHINNIAHPAHYRAYAINKCLVSRDRSVMLRAFTTYVRSLAEISITCLVPAICRSH